jgi:iron(III) transport system substrate-binding protein
MKQLLRPLASVAALAMVAACSADDSPDGRETDVPDVAATDSEPDGDTIFVYARDREIAEPLFELFEQETGITVRARWGIPSDLADQIIADGADSAADAVYLPVGDALGSLRAAGRLVPLSDEQLDRVPEAHRAADGTWVGNAGRANVVYYNTDLLSADDLPDSIQGFADPAWRGRIGWDPTQRSLQGAIEALRQAEGDAEARAWLEGMQANEPKVLFTSGAIVDAVAAGELIEVGFGSHYYLYALHLDGDAENVAAKFYPGDPAAPLQVTGVGITDSTDNKSAAGAFVDFMLSPTAQQYFAQNALEIPVVEDLELPDRVPTAAEQTIPGLDMGMLEQLDTTRDFLAAVGIIR